MMSSFFALPDPFRQVKCRFRHGFMCGSLYCSLNRSQQDWQPGSKDWNQSFTAGAGLWANTRRFTEQPHLKEP